MKIVLINSLFEPYSRGGTEIVVKNQAEKLAEKGNEVVIITSKPFFSRAITTRVKAVNIYRFYPLNIFSFYNINKFPVILRLIWHFFDMFNLHSYFRIKKILEKEKPDLVWTHNLMGIGFLIPRLIKKMKIEHQHTVHDVQLVVPSGLIIYGQENNWKQRIFLRKLWEKICRYLFNSPDKVIFPSQWLKIFYKEKGFFKDSEKIVELNYDLKKEITFKKEIKSFLYLGQLEEHKGILFLINAFRKIENKDLRLHIYGKGSLENRIRELIKNDPRIFFHGFVENSKLSEIFAKIDLTVLPTLCYENSPTVIFESLNNGVPVLASRIGGIPELIKEQKNGWLFEPNNEKDFCNRITQIMEE